VTTAPPPPAPPALSAPQQLDDLLLFRLSRLSAVGGAVVVRLCEGRYGITRRQWRLLAFVAEAGTLQPSLLAERAHLDRARTSRAVGELVAKGLVTRTACAGDQRFALLSLTPAGRRLHDDLFPRVADINRQLLGDLAAADIARLAELLDRLQASADTVAAGSPLPKAGRHRGGRRSVT
jgi:DNA-binding MarR family transcriptional regulator